MFKKNLVVVVALFMTGGYIQSQNVVIDGIPRDTSFTVHGTYVKESKRRPYIKIVEPRLQPNTVAFEGVIYSELKDTPYGNRKLHLNIYRPDNKQKYPALLMIHGGGWSSGDLTMEVPMAQRIAAKGYVAIPVEYRLSSEAVYPAAVCDLKAAVRWVKANADKYGIDTTKIAVSGCSAGGQLANLIGATNHSTDYEDARDGLKTSSSVQAVINVDGVSSFLGEEARLAADAYKKTGKKSASVKWFDGTVEEKREDWIAASALYRVSEYAVPICFINSSIPRFHDGRDDMISKLSAYGIYTEVHEIPDTPHPFWLFDPWFDTTVKYMTDFLDKTFK